MRIRRHYILPFDVAGPARTRRAKELSNAQYWRRGAVRAKEMMIAGLLLMTLAGCDREPAAWSTAKGTNTIQAYEAYLKDHASGPHAIEAKQILVQKQEDLKWDQALSSGTVKDVDLYLSEYPQGKFVTDARQLKGTLVDARDWTKAKAANTMDALESFLQQHPQSQHRAEAEQIIAPQREARAWAEATKSERVDTLAQFLSQHPTSSHAEEAKSILARLRADQDWRFCLRCPSLAKEPEVNDMSSRIWAQATGKSWRLEAQKPGYCIVMRLGSLGLAGRQFTGKVEFDSFAIGTQIVFAPGRHEMGKLVVESSVKYPLVMVVSKGGTLAYAGGQATVTQEGKTIAELGYHHRFEDVIRWMESGDPRQRIGAAWAIGWLPLDNEQRGQACQLLWRNMDKGTRTTRAVFFESLERIGDEADRKRLSSLVHPDKEPVTAGGEGRLADLAIPSKGTFTTPLPEAELVEIKGDR